MSFGGPALPPGTILAGRFRVDLVLSQTGLHLGTQLDVARAVLIQTMADPLVARRGPLLSELWRNTAVMSMRGQALLEIYEFGVEPLTRLPFLVLEYSPGRAVDEMIGATGKEAATTKAFLEIAKALIEGHDTSTYGAKVPPPSTAALSETLQSISQAPQVVNSTPPPRVRKVKRTRQEQLFDRARRGIQIVAVLGMVVLGSIIFFGSVEVPGVRHWGPGDWEAASYGEPELELERTFSPDPQGSRTTAQKVTVSSKPTGADVYQGVRRIGVTPVRVDRPKSGETLQLRISKSGFAPTSVEVTEHSPARVAVDLVVKTMDDAPAKRSWKNRSATENN